MSLLKVSELIKFFDNQAVVNHISFTLEEGAILSILGESGSGKTSLLHLIAGLYEPDSGTLMLDNQRITPPSEKLIAGHPDIKLVRQDYGLFPNISLRANIAYELRYYEEEYKQKRVDNLLSISGLIHVQHHLPRQVSGGEQQRAVIAKAIAEEPKLLLLDEPFSHLDSLNKNKIKNELFRMIKTEKIACIFVTHDVEDAYGIADDLLVMKKGEILQIGKPEHVYQHPNSQYVAEITGKVNILPATLLTLLGGNDFSSTFLRPENIIFNSNSSCQGIVKKVQFLGAYYEMSIKIDDFMIQVYDFDKKSVGEKVGLQIRNSFKQV